jgi:hypothetical protein
MKFGDVLRCFSPDPAGRRRARFRIMESYAEHNGFHVYKEHMLWARDAGFCEIRRAHPLPGIPEDRCFVLYEAVRSVAGVPGDLVECGVRFGKSATILRCATEATGKTLHLFDSFEGISDPEPADHPESGAYKDWRRGMLAVDESTVRRNLAGLQRIELHRGWIPERFSDVATLSFCFVHIDLDLYRPTRDSLAFFYPHLSPGGILICDDYGSGYCPGARKACDEYLADKPETLLHLPTGQALLIKR